MAESRQQRRVALCGVAGLAVLGLIWWINARYTLFVPLPLPVAWALTAGLTVGFIALVSFALRGRGAGILIDSRNRISLSRFQALAWTVFILSALIAVAGWRIYKGLPVPLSVNIPGELLAAMGISAASLVATPALLSVRSARTADVTDTAAPAASRIAAKTGRALDAAANAGVVLGWQTLADAQWMDMFRGEDVSDGATADLTKIQQFLITVLLLAVYAGALWTFFSHDDQVLANVTVPGQDFQVSLPILTQSFIWLLGISHAGYLISKAVPSAPDPAARTPPAA